MGKPILERMARPGWWGDQGWHALAGLVAGSAVADPLAYGLGWPVSLCAFLAVLACGIGAVAYEAAQNWGDAPEEGSQMDSIFDLGGFWLGTAFSLLTLLGV